MYGNVRATCTMKMMNGTFIIGMVVSRGTNPLFNLRNPPIPATVVQVMSVANPKPDVGMTRGNVTMSSNRLFPRNSLRPKM